MIVYISLLVVKLTNDTFKSEGANKQSEYLEEKTKKKDNAVCADRRRKKKMRYDVITWTAKKKKTSRTYSYCMHRCM